MSGVVSGVLSKKKLTLSLIVLAYNEAQNVPEVLAELLMWLEQHQPNSEVILIDDGSSDNTSDAAKRAFSAHSGQVRGQVIRHATNRGMGAGIKTGARAATGEWLTFLPADGQIPPSGVGALMRGRQSVDLVLSVYEDRDDGAARKVLSWGVRALIRATYGVNIQSEGPYLVRREILDPAQLKADTFFLNFELPIRALEAGLRSTVVTMKCRSRLSGKSKTAHPGRALGVAKELVGLRFQLLADTLKRALG